MGSNGHINSIEVAVLCLMQKITNERNARSSKMTIEIHVRANTLTLCPNNYYYLVHTITSSSYPAIVFPTAFPKITKY